VVNWVEYGVFARFGTKGCYCIAGGCNVHAYHSASRCTFVHPQRSDPHLCPCHTFFKVQPSSLRDAVNAHFFNGAIAFGAALDYDFVQVIAEEVTTIVFRVIFTCLCVDHEAHRSIRGLLQPFNIVYGCLTFWYIAPALRESGCCCCGC
jgi:hypothetical protein